MSGATTRKEIIEDDAIIWGKEYAANVELAKAKNKEFIESILALNEANLKLRVSRNDTDYVANQKRTNELGEKSVTIWKEQIQLENALISTKKKNELATESTNRALVKERTVLQETNKEIKAQAREQLGLVTAYERLNKQRTDSQKRLADLLSAEKKNTAQIVVAQDEFNKLDVRVKAVDASINNYTKNIGNYQSAFNGLGGTLRDVVSAFGLVTGIALFGTVVKDVFTVIKDFDRQLIAVGKTTDISGEDLKQFGREVVDLGDKLDGVTVAGLIQSAEVAGQLGVTGTANILKFSEAIEKLKLTSNIISEEQVGQFAKFIEVSSDSFENADRLASVITQLGNAYATTEAEVLANATEIQKSVSVYKTSAQGVLALGSATSTLGSEAEVSGSAIQKTFGVINKAIATGKNLADVLKLTNLTQSELSKQFNTDATGVFVKFVKGLSDARKEGQNLQSVLGGLQLDEVRTFKVIGSLAANYAILEGSMAQANKEYELNAALNKEVAAASESIDSIISDLNDRWEAYILQTNDAAGGTQAFTKILKFLRDNFKEIIDFVLKAGAIFITYLGIIKTYNFVIAASTALQTAWTAGQIRFALSTGIGTKAILEQAAAARAATTAQEGLNIATKATPWGIIIALLAAAVVAYAVFNESLSETEIRLNAVQRATKRLQEIESSYTSERDKNRAAGFGQLETEIELRKAQGESSKKLDEEEIKRKKEIVAAQLKTFEDLKQVEIERTKNQIEESNKRVDVLQKEFDKVNAFALTNPFGESTKDKKVKLIDAKAENDALKATLKENSRITIEEQGKLKKIITELEQQGNIKDANIKTEEDKKAIEARKKRLKEIYDAEKKAADDLFKLQQFRIQVAIDVDKEIIANDKAGFDEKISALLDSQQLIQAKTKEAAVREFQLLGTYNEDKGKFVREFTDLQINEIIRTGKIFESATNGQRLIFEKYQNDLTNNAKKGELDRQKLIDDQAAIVQKDIERKNLGTDTELNDRLANENRIYAEILNSAKDNFELVEAAKIGHEQRMLKISNEYARKKIQTQIDGIQFELDENAKREDGAQLSVNKRKEIENQLSQYKKQLSELNVETAVNENAATLENKKATAEKLLQLEKSAHERTLELAENLAASIIDFTNAIFDAKIASIDAEIQESNAYYDEQIELAGNDARQKELLEKEKAKKQKELEKERKKELIKAAIFNKVIALAQIGIDLAKTLTAIQLAAAELDAISFGTAGTPYRAIQIPLAIGTAAFQAGMVLAAPLPKYKLGRKGGPEEMAVVGDGGVSEIITNKHGSNPIITPSKPTLAKLNKDDIVFKNFDEYKKYLNKAAMKSMSDDSGRYRDYQINVSGGFTDEQINKKLEEVVRAIKAQKSQTKIENRIDFGHEQFRWNNIKWHN